MILLYVGTCSRSYIAETSPLFLNTYKSWTDLPCNTLKQGLYRLCNANNGATDQCSKPQSKKTVQINFRGIKISPVTGGNFSKNLQTTDLPSATWSHTIFFPPLFLFKEFFLKAKIKPSRIWEAGNQLG